MSGPGTPLPWAVSKGKARRVTANGVLICNATLRNMGTTAQNKYGKLEADAEANAAFIVRACNNHDALLEALEEAEVLLSGDFFTIVELKRACCAFLNNARAAIAAGTDAGS